MLPTTILDSDHEYVAVVRVSGGDAVVRTHDRVFHLLSDGTEKSVENLNLRLWVGSNSFEYIRKVYADSEEELRGSIKREVSQFNAWHAITIGFNHYSYDDHEPKYSPDIRQGFAKIAEDFIQNEESYQWLLDRCREEPIFTFLGDLDGINAPRLKSILIKFTQDAK